MRMEPYMVRKAPYLMLRETYLVRMVPVPGTSAPCFFLACDRHSPGTWYRYTYPWYRSKKTI